MVTMFVIDKIYKLEGQKYSHLVHIDAYRLEGPQELPAIGWHDLLKDSKNLVVVEWADRIEVALPKNARRLSFRSVDETTREII